MTAKTHILSISPIVFLPLSLLNNSNFSFASDIINGLQLTNAGYLTIFIYATIFGSLLPDIDEPGSLIGSRTRGVSDIIKALFGHRGITHTVIFLSIFLIIAFVYPSGIIHNLAFGLFFGVFAHIIGDMLTKGGVLNFLYPLTPSVRFVLLPRTFRVFTNGIIEKMLIIPILLLSFPLVIDNFLLSFGYISKSLILGLLGNV